MWPRGMGAVVFDMDGTLVDSEPFTMRAIAGALEQRGCSAAGLKAESFHGVTWQAIATVLLERFPNLPEPITPAELQATFHQLHRDEPPSLIEGAHQALLAARSLLPTAICTSSSRESLQDFVHRLKIPELMRKSVCGDDCTRSKPDPQGYLLVASRLGVSPERCLVFEDSVAGVNAARAAGMYVVAVTGRSSNGSAVSDAAHEAIGNYSQLPSDFFQGISQGTEST